MNYFETVITPDAAQWQIGILQEEDDRLMLNKRYRFAINEFWDINEVINVKLWYRESGLPNSKNLGFCDFHVWTGNQMRTPPLNGQPVGKTLIMSRIIKDKLNHFKHCPHRYYELDVEKEDTKERRKYYLLKMIGNQIEYLNFNEVVFELKLGTEVVKTFKRSEISSQLEYEHELIKYQQQNKSYSLLPQSYIYREKFDVIWGDGNKILLSSKAKEAIEKLNPKGCEFKEFGGKEIGFSN